MDKREDCCTTHLIDGDGTFNVAGIDNFVKKVKLAECGLSYAVVAIMGPQSSGKSTLLNHLFGTDFRVMDADEGRSQTTKGIWLAQCIGIEPCTLVMDLEGTDGREREDDTAFEKQSALFALAVSDIVLINMWCHDIGREQAANKPLLKTVFQVMMRLFSPRKTTLMFVIRDKTRTPLGKLESLLRKDIQKIWDSIPKPQAHMESPLSEFFNVEVVALSSYEYMEELFKEQVASLRQRFFHSTAPGGLAGDRRGVVPASAFSFSTQQIWKVIKENKDLDLKKQLEKAYQFMLKHIRSETLGRFKEAFDNALKEGKDFAAAARDCTEYFMSQFDDAATDARIGLANWDSSKDRELLYGDIAAYIAAKSKEDDDWIIAAAPFLAVAVAAAPFVAPLAAGAAAGLAAAAVTESALAVGAAAIAAGGAVAAFIFGDH